MEQTIEKLYSWASGGKAAPDEVQIYPTNRCNLRCRFCCQQLGEYRVEDDLSVERWLEVARELCSMGVNRILLSGGGEPLATPATIELIELFKSKGVHGRMIHNGTLWDDGSIKRLVRSGWDSLTFSVDGLERTHDYLRGVDGCFAATTGNIRKINEMKKRMDSKAPVMEITCVLTRQNFREIPGMVALAGSLGIRNFSVEPVCVNNPEAAGLRISREEREELLSKILPEAGETARKLDISTNFHKLADVRVVEKAGELKEEIGKRAVRDTKPVKYSTFISSPCYEPWLWPKIEANGEVWPCSTVPLKENVKEKSFEEIWYGPVLTAFRRDIMAHKLSESCSNCVFTHLHTMARLREDLCGYVRKRDSS